MLARFKNGGSTGDYPPPGFKPDITIDITAGQVSVSGAIDNINDFNSYGTSFADVFSSELRINGNAASLTVNSVTGAVSSGSHSVSPGAKIEVVFVAYRQIASSTPDWGTVQTTMWMTIEETAGAGNSSNTYKNPSSLPEWNARLGWKGGAGDFSVDVEYVSAGAAGGSASIETRLAGGGSSSSSTLNPSGSGVQTHTASFDKAGAGSTDVIMEISQDYDANISERFGMKWLTPGDIGAKPASGWELEQREVSGHIQIDNV